MVLARGNIKKLKGLHEVLIEEIFQQNAPSSAIPLPKRLLFVFSLADRISI
jgi:hypothetical protein